MGAESNYISKITHGGKELGEFDGGSGSGWMGTLNDWFTNRGFGDGLPQLTATRSASCIPVTAAK